MGTSEGTVKSQLAKARAHLAATLALQDDAPTEAHHADADDKLRTRLQRAAPRHAGADNLPDRLAQRRRRRASQRAAGRVALVAAVLVGTIAGVAVLDRAFRGGAPVVSQPPVPNPDQGEDGTMSLEGVPFRVCRPMSIPGDFGAGVDTLWVLEEESEPGAGCSGKAPSTSRSAMRTVSPR